MRRHFVTLLRIKMRGKRINSYSRHVVILHSTKLLRQQYFHVLSNINLHTLFQETKIIGAVVAHASEVCAPAMLLLML